MKTQNLFYAHLVDLKDLEELLHHKDIEHEERVSLLSTAQETIHIEVIHFILEQIPDHERHVFMHNVEHKPHDTGLWLYVTKRIDGADDKIVNIIHQVKQDFKEALHEYKEASEEWLSGVDIRHGY